MVERIKRYVDETFEKALEGRVMTRNLQDLKEEVTSNLIGKYTDLIGAGKNEDEAAQTAISSMGDLEELIQVMVKEDEKGALMLAWGIGLLFIGMVPPILLGDTGYWDTLAAAAMFVIWAAGVGLIVYSRMVSPRRPAAKDAVKNYDDYYSGKVYRRERGRGYNSIIWPAATLLFLCFGMFFGAWSYAWLVFPLAWVVSMIVREFWGGHR